MMNIKKVSVIGLGRLGLPFALCLAKKGFKVIGVDIDIQKIDLLNKKIAPFFEPELKDYLDKFGSSFHPTDNYEKAVRETDVFFVIVATPSDRKGNFSNIYVESALKKLATELKKVKNKYKLIIINSTVMPTSTEKRFIKIIEKYSGKKINRDFGVCYIPDFVALGKVIKDFLNPDFVLIGESNKLAGDIAEKIYKKLCDNNSPIYRMSIISAEIAKMSLNVFITIKISFANILGNICAKIKGAEVDKITQAIGADKRISPYYLKAGLSFGGNCFPRDVRAFNAFLEKLNYPRWLSRAIENINKSQDRHLFDVIKKYIKEYKAKKISILGLSFKPNTSVIEASPSITLINNILSNKLKIDIYVYDPAAIENTQKVFKNKIFYCRTMKECIQNSDIIVIATPWDEFKNINPSLLKRKNKKVALFDCWRILNPEKYKKLVKYLALGIDF
jgi:UDPglucose 6-dehydrogenase